LLEPLVDEGLVCTPWDRRRKIAEILRYSALGQGVGLFVANYANVCFDVSKIDHRIKPESIEAAEAFEDRRAVDILCIQSEQSCLTVRVDRDFRDVWVRFNERLAKHDPVVDCGDFGLEDRSVVVQVAERLKEGGLFLEDMYPEASPRFSEFAAVCVDGQTGCLDRATQLEAVREDLVSADLKIIGGDMIPVLQRREREGCS
jgi:hypothetical protein